MARTAGVMCIDFMPDDHNLYADADSVPNIALTRQVSDWHGGRGGAPLLLLVQRTVSLNVSGPHGLLCAVSVVLRLQGAVYRVCSNPIEPKVLMTFSADWTVRLWIRVSLLS